MLGQPDAVETELFRPRHLLDLAPDDFGVGKGRRSLEEVVGAEAHGSPAGLYRTRTGCTTARWSRIAPNADGESRCALDTSRCRCTRPGRTLRGRWRRDRKSTRLNSSHSQISYAVFCLKKKKEKTQTTILHATCT